MICEDVTEHMALLETSLPAFMAQLVKRYTYSDDISGSGCPEHDIIIIVLLFIASVTRIADCWWPNK